MRRTMQRTGSGSMLGRTRFSCPRATWSCASWIFPRTPVIAAPESACPPRSGTAGQSRFSGVGPFHGIIKPPDLAFTRRPPRGAPGGGSGVSHRNACRAETPQTASDLGMTLNLSETVDIYGRIEAFEVLYHGKKKHALSRTVTSLVRREIGPPAISLHCSYVAKSP